MANHKFMLEIWHGTVEQADDTEMPCYGLFDEEAQCMVLFAAAEVDATTAKHGYAKHGPEFVEGIVHRYHELYQQQSTALYALDYSLLLDRTFIQEVEVEVGASELPPTTPRTLH